MDSPEITQARANLSQATAALETVTAPILATIAQSRAALDAALLALDLAKDEHRPLINTLRDSLVTLLRAEWPIARRDQVAAMAIAAGAEGLEVVSHRDWLDGTPGDRITRASCRAGAAVSYGENGADNPRFTAAPLIHVRRAVLARFQEDKETRGGGEGEKEAPAA